MLTGQFQADTDYLLALIPLIIELRIPEWLQCRYIECRVDELEKQNESKDC